MKLEHPLDIITQQDKKSAFYAKIPNLIYRTQQGGGHVCAILYIGTVRLALICAGICIWYVFVGVSVTELDKIKDTDNVPLPGC